MSRQDKPSNYMISQAQLDKSKARAEKAEFIKTLGDPIQLTGVALSILLEGNSAWIAENTKIAKKIDLVSGRTLLVFKGHNGPVSALARWEGPIDARRGCLITGSWDKSIKIWDKSTKECLSTTDAHTDFVKALVVLDSAQLLVSSGSDKVVRFWDLTTALNGPLVTLGTISAHTRPVECLDGRVVSDNEVELCTADTMGVIRLWNLTRIDDGSSLVWKPVQKAQFGHHRTGVTDLKLGPDILITASSDETVQVHPLVEDPKTKPPPPITHPTAAKAVLSLSLTDLAEPYIITGAGEVIRTYDVSTPDSPELLSEIDGHSHDVTSLQLWMRKNPATEDKPASVEPWIVSVALDGTIRKWRLSDLLSPPPPPPPKLKAQSRPSSGLTEEEDRELDDLLNSD